MCRRTPDASLVMLSNEMNASVFKGGRDWNWEDDTVKSIEETRKEDLDK